MANKKRDRDKYKAITYHMGNVVDEIETEDIDKISKLCQNSLNMAVRVFVNGRKLTYNESNTMFRAKAGAFYY